MKLKLITFFAVLVFASVSGLPSAQAQTHEVETANVPFDFYAGGQKMPAGNYTVGVDLMTQVIVLTDQSGKKIFLMGIPAAYGDDKSELIFKHSEDAYALEEIKTDVIDLMFRTRVPELSVESRMELPSVEVALNR